MTHIRIKGFKIFKDRHGRMRCYHRKTGLPVKAQIGTNEFLAECARISQLVETAGEPKPGTLGMLIAAYRGSSSFSDLAKRTRSDYQKIFDYLNPIGNTALATINRPLIVRIRDRAAQKRGRRFGNYVKQVFSLLFAWGLDRGYLAQNLADGIKSIKRSKTMPRANRPWSDEERYAVLDAAPPQLKVPLALGMFAGLREGDTLRLPKTAYTGSALSTTTSKTGQRVFWPVSESLKEILENAPPHSAITLAATSEGQPWTEGGFRASWRRLKVKLEKEGKIEPGLTFHGLRHTVATNLREAGLDERSIADALGQKTEGMARHYSREADLKPKMIKVAKLFEANENKRRLKVVKPS